MKYILSITIYFIISTVSAQLPASDAVFEKITKEYVLNEDGSMDFSYYKKLKLLSYYSFNRLYGETFIVYNPDYQTLKINKAVVTQKDGKVVPAPENAFNEVMPRFAANAPYYNHLREMVVTHSGVELDAAIELDYSIHTDAGYFPALMAEELLSEISPVQEEIITIKIPADKELHYKVFNLRTSPEIRKDKKMKVYKFTFRALKENPHESFQQADGSHLPRLIFSTITMTEAQQFLAGQEALNYKADESMKEVVKKIKEESTNDLSVILKIQEIVANAVNTYNIPPVYTGFTARPAIEIWKSNGGTHYEKSLLLVTLLRAAGVHAETVAIIHTALFDKSIGCLPQITDFIVQANPRELEQMYLSATKVNGQNLIFSMNGNTTLLLNPEKLSVTSVNEDFNNKVEMAGDFTIDDSIKVTGNIETVVFERTNPYYELKKDTNSIKQIIGGGISKADLVSVKLLNNAQVRSIIKYEIKTGKPLRNQANYYFFEIPLNTKGTESWHLNYLSAEREIPLEVPFPVNESYNYTITLPDNVMLVNPVEKIGRKTDFGSLDIEVEQTGNKITVSRNFVITNNLIPAYAYKEFKEMFDLWNEKNFRELILKKEINGE